MRIFRNAWFVIAAFAASVYWLFRHGFFEMLMPPRKSEAKAFSEKVEEEVQKRHAERAQEAIERIESIHAEAKVQEDADPVAWANDIVKRN